MTKDLEETLAELGPCYREVVDRLTDAYRPLNETNLSVLRLPTSTSTSLSSRGHLFRWTAAYLVAASLLVFLGLGVLFRHDLTAARDRAGVSDAKMVYTVAYAADASALQAIVASQRADGSWSNDFITRQNAAALRGATDATSLVAYKRALRYLRSRGLEPLTDAELKARSDRAARVLSGNC